MIYCLGFLISLAAGFLTVRLLTAGRLNFILHILLALELGLGINGLVTFYTQILFNQFNRWLPIGIVILGTSVLFFNLYKEFLKNSMKLPKKNKSSSKIKQLSSLTGWAFWADFQFTPAQGWGLLALAILAIPLAICANYFYMGGWDAWSCWNLKAKFIFSSQENWRDVLSPNFWRSNTHYPLLWPLINVWFSDLAGNFDQTIPMLNSITITLLTAGILLFGLLDLTASLWASIGAAIAVTALPFGLILYTSQYSDALVGLFLLSAFLCLVLSEKHDIPKLKILSMVFLGLMSFTKNEGLVLAAIAAMAIFWHERNNKKQLKNLIITFLITALPTIIFTLFIAPKNEAFINGLLSANKPTHWTRLAIILMYPWRVEFIASYWHGLWYLIFSGIILAGRKLWKSILGIIGLTLTLYIGIVMANYAINTFFEIGWWLSTTLSRILFALLPTIVLWLGLGLTLTAV